MSRDTWGKDVPCHSYSFISNIMFVRRRRRNGWQAMIFISLGLHNELSHGLMEWRWVLERRGGWGLDPLGRLIDFIWWCFCLQICILVIYVYTRHKVGANGANWPLLDHLSIVSMCTCLHFSFLSLFVAIQFLKTTTSARTRPMYSSNLISANHDKSRKVENQRKWAKSFFFFNSTWSWLLT